MYDKQNFGFQAMFADRDSLNDAMIYFGEVLNATPNGSDKVGLMTGAFVLTNTLAKMTTHLANALEANMGPVPKLIDGTSVDDINLQDFVLNYDLPFESAAVLERFGPMSVNAVLGAVLKEMPPMARTYIMMAIPKQKDVTNADTDVQTAPLE